MFYALFKDLFKSICKIVSVRQIKERNFCSALMTSILSRSNLLKTKFKSHMESSNFPILNYLESSNFRTLLSKALSIKIQFPVT